MEKDLKALIKLRADLIVNAIKSFSLSGYETYILCFTADIKDLPKHLYANETITLNVSVNATGAFEVIDDFIRVKVSFSNKACDLFIPFRVIVQVIAVENDITVITFLTNNGLDAMPELIKRYNNYCEQEAQEKASNNSPNIHKSVSTDIIRVPAKSSSKAVSYLKRVK